MAAMKKETIIEMIWAALTENIGVKVISVVVAIVLWVIVLGSRNVEVTKEIPIQIVTPNNVLVANELPDRVAFRLSGPKAFLRAVLDRREDPIRVDLTGAKPGLVTYRFFSDNIRVPIGVKVMSINPTAILIKLDAIKRREVPVKVELHGVPPEGFRIAKTEVDPPVVKIKGPESRVDSVTEVSTVPVDVSSLRQNLEREVSLDLLKLNVQLDGPLPRVLIQVEPISANYRIKNVDIRVLTSYKVRLSEKTVTVLVRAEPQDLKLLDRSRVYAVVDLTGKKKGKYTENIRVTLPEGVGLVKTIPEKVQVTLY